LIDEELSTGLKDSLVNAVATTPAATLSPSVEIETINKSFELHISSVTYASPKHLVIAVILQLHDREIPLKAMIDSGATGDFINIDLVRQYQIPTVKLEKALSLSVVDGREIESGSLTHTTTSVTMKHGDHSESLHLIPTCIGRHQIILGTP
jgi:hypothetical protein